MSDRISELRQIISNSPGADEFVELAAALAPIEAERPAAREICLRGLTENPKNLRGRLILARLYLLDGMTEFCVRELLELRKRVETPSLERLLETFEPVIQSIDAARAQSSTKITDAVENVEKELTEAQSKAELDEVMAEIDFDEDFLDVLDDLEDKE